MDFCELKQEVLNVQLIRQLLSDKDTLAIYLGGSRLFGLELPDSDYDVIVISKNKAILGLFGETLGIPGINVHLQTIYFPMALKWLSMPSENVKEVHAVCLLQMLWPDILYFYKSEEYSSIKTILETYSDEMIYFCLEHLLEMLDHPDGNKKYIKAHYHYICFDTLLNNYISHNKIFFSPEQILQLREIKKKRMVSIKTTNRIFKQYQLYYEQYIKIYQEVIACQKKFI